MQNTCAPSFLFIWLWDTLSFSFKSTWFKPGFTWFLLFFYFPFRRLLRIWVLKLLMLVLDNGEKYVKFASFCPPLTFCGLWKYFSIILLSNTSSEIFLANEQIEWRSLLILHLSLLPKNILLWHQWIFSFPLLQVWMLEIMENNVMGNWKAKLSLIPFGWNLYDSPRPPPQPNFFFFFDGVN